MKKKSNNYLWGILIGLVVLIGIAVFSSSAALIDPIEDAELTISDMTWDFGDIPMSEGVATQSISLTNDTDQTITVTGMETSCMCTTAQIVHADGSKSGLKGMVGHGGSSNLSETIQAGEVATLFVNFDPNAHGPSATVPITRNVMLRTNSQSQPVIELTFSGNVIK